MLTTLACLLAFGLAAQVQSRADDAATAELSQLESAWNEAHLHADANALDRLWADDLMVFVPRMTPMTKAEALAFVRSGRMRFERYETSDVNVRVYGGSAVVSGRLRRSRQLGGRSVEDDWRFTKVYVHGAKGWRVVAFHASEAG